ncbi:hypothetical protein PWG71_27900 [Nocardiopsis sp. N85]|uniref:hypothetical protein n=1 Tax=Nocardiopsis sp. N85 TaxID=3029400 RepID=UPI00237F6ABC|nr:hypothetical protein [Nocardiopsis sp. N85]MDE3725221.1 hypothetical protein [Nocardiopsis sp. N85]
MRARLYGPFPWRAEPVGERGCRIRVSADSPQPVVRYTAAVVCPDTEATVERAPPEIAERPPRAGRALLSCP